MIKFTFLYRYLVAFVFAVLFVSASTQEVTIPDAGLNATVRATLNKPAGPLTETDMLQLTLLNAHDRNISNLAGLETARNLNTLLLYSNHLTNFSQPTLTNLVSLNLSGNPLTNVSLPSGASNLFSLIIRDNPLTALALPAGYVRLEELDLSNNQLDNISVPSTYTSLGVIDLSFNLLTNLTLPAGLANLDTLNLSGNALTDFTPPAGLTRLTQLYVDQNQFEAFTLPPRLTNLHVLNFSFNQLTNLNLPPDQRNLIDLELENNRFSKLDLPSNLTNLAFLRLRSNQLTNFNLPPDVRSLSFLDLGENQLQSVNLPAGLGHLITLRLSGNTNLYNLTLPVGMTNLTGIFLRFNSLTNLTLPTDLNHLSSLDALANHLTSLRLPSGLTNLATLILSGNGLTSLTLPPDMMNLTSLIVPGNPLTELILPEPLAGGVLLETVTTLGAAGVPIFAYLLNIHLTAANTAQLIGPFRFTITGPPGDYTIRSSGNLIDWITFGATQLPLGAIVVTDPTAQFSSPKFYMAFQQAAPSNMVFIPPTTFTMGSSNDEIGHQPDEGPRTSVTLTHPFWIGKHEVTQGEYLAVTGENPSGFPGDLNRPVESVSFFAASNYCALLTQSELTAGRIPPGAHYRLPTEAEWECAARAGTTTRFYYGDDFDLTALRQFAWFGAHDGITTHPVEQKQPNAYGLYDVAGNVWEWCQDWYGAYPGGSVVDPTGPASNVTGVKVIRGGAWESSEFDCRSASRWFEGASPFISDFIIGFRVVLAFD